MEFNTCQSVLVTGISARDKWLRFTAYNYAV